MFAGALLGTIVAVLVVRPGLGMCSWYVLGLGDVLVVRPGTGGRARSTSWAGDVLVVRPGLGDVLVVWYVLDWGTCSWYVLGLGDVLIRPSSFD